MAAVEQRRTSRYEVYGNVAYDPVWEGGAVAVPVPERQEVLRPRPNVRPKERTLARPRVQVREAGKVSPFAVVGFFSIAVMAVLLLMCCVRLTILNDESVHLRNQLSDLQAEEADLLAHYELAYDLQAIETELLASGTMVRPTSEQMVVLDLSEPDNVVVYSQNESTGSVVDSVKDFVSDLLA